MMDYLIRIEREDKQKMSCIIDLPVDFLQVSNSNNTKYDKLLDNKVMDKIYFEGLGFVCIEILPLPNGIYSYIGVE